MEHNLSRGIWRTSGAVACAIVASGLLRTARAEDQAPGSWVNKVHGVIALASAGGDANVRMEYPPIALDPWMDTTQVRNRLAVSRVFDAAPLASSAAGRSTPRISQIYREILDNSSWARSALNAEQHSQLANALKVLFSDEAHSVPTKGYSNYLTLKKRVDTLQRVWDTTPADSRTATMASDLQDARDDLVLNGNPGAFTRAEATAKALTLPSPTTTRDRLLTLYNAALVTGSDGSLFAPADFEAGYERALRSADWTRLQISARSSEVGLTAIWGSRSTDQGRFATTDSAATEVTVSFELASLPVSRTWLDKSVFQNRTWRWTDDSHALLSDGAKGTDGPRGLLPVIPVDALVARNIVITADLPESEWNQIQRAVLDGRTLTWGPFTVSGSYFDPQRRQFSGRRIGSSLHVADAQIIGWLIESLPKSPNPDPQLDWSVKKYPSPEQEPL